MNIDTLPMIPSYSGGPHGPGRRARAGRPDLIVVHTNEGAEHLSGAENLAAWMARPQPPDYPAYQVAVDGDSAVRCALDTERVNGAGGVAARALHVVIIGYARQSAVEWDDPFSAAAIDLAADVCGQWSRKWGIPLVRLAPSQIRAGTIAGTCGHVDVAAVYPQSQGHTDPGPHFPWPRLLRGATGTRPDPEDDDVPEFLLEDAHEPGKGQPKRIAVGTLTRARQIPNPDAFWRAVAYLRSDGSHAIEFDDHDPPRPVVLKVAPPDLDAALAR